MRERAVTLFRTRQSEICQALETLDGQQRFGADEWQRKEGERFQGGGGTTCILKSGGVFEQAGVNFSEVFGSLPPEMCRKLVGVGSEQSFYATGISLVLHPFSPLIPTVHANFRYLEVADKKWFGGGMDLTPYYLVEDDAGHFHRSIKAACDKHDPAYYARFKKWCDEYFYLPHRGETRGIGGVFFDYLGKEEPGQLERIFAFVTDCSAVFVDAYVPIAERWKAQGFTQEQKEFQLLRRGRYVEFNLLYDRGTQFGLQTGGRVESILMSLPPVVRWQYNAAAPSGTREEELISVLRNPREWA